MNRLAADQSFRFRFAAARSTSALLGLHLRGSPHLAGAFGAWFPLSLFLEGIGATSGSSRAGSRRGGIASRQEERERELVGALVRAWGADTLAPFTLRGQVVLLRARTGARSSPTASSEGSRSSPATRSASDRFDDLIGGSSRSRTAATGAWRFSAPPSSWLALYSEHGLHALYHGDEAIVDTETFALEGRAIRKVRQSVHRLERRATGAEVLRPSEIDADLRRGARVDRARVARQRSPSEGS